MTQHRPFRFGAYAGTSVDDWIGRVQRVEALGYSTLSVSDRIITDLAPISALASAAVATSTIRIGSLTFGNDFRNPVMLAREAASLDVLSGGRFEFGFGSGYFRMDYDWAGIPLDQPSARMDRFFEAVRLIKRAFSGGTVAFDGEHYRVHGLSLKPSPVQRPWPPLMIGGGGKRILQFAAREADIVGINARSTADGGFDWASFSPEATAQQVRWVREAAGDRFAQLEIHSVASHVAITDDPEEAARDILAQFRSFGADETFGIDDVLARPGVLIGSEDAIVEMIQQRREEYGFSYITVFPDVMEAFAPIVARLTGK